MNKTTKYKILKTLLDLYFTENDADKKKELSNVIELIAWS